MAGAFICAWVAARPAANGANAGAQNSGRGHMFTKQLKTVGDNAEKVTRNISVSLNVGVIVASVALLVATVALVVAVNKS